jgi:hypothetical protein
MKKRVLFPIAALLLCFTVACSQTVYQQIVGYVNEFLPVAEAVANLILATEAPGTVAAAQPIETQINNDLQLIESTASTITTQNYSDKRAAILALANDAKTQLGAYLTATHVSNPATVAKVTAYVDLGVAVIDEIVNALPAQNASVAQLAVFNAKVGNVRVNYKKQFNHLTRAKTGDAKVDAALAKVKLFKRFGVLAY